MKYFELMKNACDSVGMNFDEDKYNKFITYKNLLQEWNEKINLTAITEDEEVIKKHFIDCIKAFSENQFKEAKTLIDVGTGAGFPGLPIAIMKEDLNITNVTTIHSRAEDGARNKELREKFDIATSRAVANMAVLSEFCLPYVKVGGYFIALKGPAITDELNDAKNAIGTLGGKLIEVIEVSVEGTDLKHNLVVIKKVKETPKTYPRKAGSITKKPIK